MNKQKKHTDLSDEELIKRYQISGDNHWLGYALERYTILLLGVAMKYLKNKEAAEDAVQQIFLKALTHLPKEEILNFKGWLYVLIRNHCLQELRNKSYKTPEGILENLTIADNDKEHLIKKEFTLEQMNESLNELNEEQCKTIKMFYLQKLSYQQITEQTGYSFMQVKSFIQNGKRNLKLILQKKIGDNYHE